MTQPPFVPVRPAGPKLAQSKIAATLEAMKAFFVRLDRIKKETGLESRIKFMIQVRRQLEPFVSFTVQAVYLP